MATTKSENTTVVRPLRVAIEGCGHGTLDAIYASIIRGCEAKGWDSVDLVIICGDFQAVRNRTDLNVTAMPAKYREMADFHQYYWGTKKAPFLTVFIGGNHEASNHLWELYYGGWAAPNIYYLGAANVIQFGPLKIASMSGIWKGYDYKKPHYERLPYSNDDMYSIYHVRELDVRKLLAYRSQVDIGLSHDWPRGIEWLGNHQQLFQHKRFLKEDADAGRLGNVAAKDVLDHLRPRYWFAAHLHVRYTAIKKHGDQIIPDNESVVSHEANATIQDQPQNDERLAAWRNFEAVAKEDEAKETAQQLQEQSSRRAEAERTGIPITADFRYNETYKRVKLADGFSRTVTSVVTDSPSVSASTKENHESSGQISQLDGCCVSRPSKRHHSPNSDDRPDASSQGYLSINTDGPSMILNSTVAAQNPDAIDLDLTDDEDDLPNHSHTSFQKDTEDSPLLPDKQNHGVRGAGGSTQDTHEVEHTLQSSQTDGASHTAAGDQDPIAVTHPTDDFASGTVNRRPPIPPHHGQEKFKDVRSVEASQGAVDQQSMAKDDSARQTTSEDEVSEEMRAQLAALSTKFADKGHIERSAALPHPEDIQNDITKFLALSKCAPGQRFLQLMEIQPCDQNSQQTVHAPTLRYDPQWLAILRVFSSELTLGGTARDQIPAHRGDTYYRDAILEEEKWIQGNVVDKDLLAIPNNFVNTLADIEELDQTPSEMPHEGTNPQTTTFCSLIGINNHFDMSESDREARRARGPSASNNSQRGRGGFSHQGNRGGRGHGRGRGGRGGRGRGSRH